METKNRGTCDLDLISAAVDGELGADERNRLESHLEVCPTCRAKHTEMLAVTRLCGHLPEVPLPATLAREIQEHLAKEACSRASGGFWTRFRSLLNPEGSLLRPAFAGGFAVVLLLVGLALLRSPQPPVGATGVALVAQADEEVAGLDLVISFDPERVLLEEVDLSEISKDFMLAAHKENGEIHVSMASANGIRLDGTKPGLAIPFQIGARAPKGEDLVRLGSARAYRSDGTLVRITLKPIPMLPAADSRKDTTA